MLRLSCLLAASLASCIGSTAPSTPQSPPALRWRGCGQCGHSGSSSRTCRIRRCAPPPPLPAPRRSPRARYRPHFRPRTCSASSDRPRGRQCPTCSSTRTLPPSPAGSLPNAPPLNQPRAHALSPSAIPAEASQTLRRLANSRLPPRTSRSNATWPTRITRHCRVRYPDTQSQPPHRPLDHRAATAGAPSPPRPTALPRGGAPLIPHTLSPTRIPLPQLTGVPVEPAATEFRPGDGVRFDGGPTPSTGP